MAPAARTRRVKAEATHTEPALSTRDIGRRAASGAALLTAKGILRRSWACCRRSSSLGCYCPSQLGLYAIAVTISTFLLMLGGGVGMAGALIRRPAAPEHADLRAFVALQLIVSSILVVVVVLATRPFGLVGQLTAVMVVSAPITAFRGAGPVVLERQLLYKRIATAETAEMLVYYAWTVVTVAIGWGLWGLATATVARSVVGTAFIVAAGADGSRLATIRPPAYPRDARDRRASTGGRLRRCAPRSDPGSGHGGYRKRLRSSPIGASSFERSRRPRLLLLTLLRVSFPAMSRTRSAGGDPASHAATPPACGNNPHRHAARAARGAAPALVPLLFGDKWSPAADALSLACLAVVIHTPVLIAAPELSLDSW